MWKLWLDDVRNPPSGSNYTILRNTIMAVATIVKRRELPSFMSLDHDLGEDDNAIKFLKELYVIWEMYGSDPKKIPNYIVHSANPVGTKNIVSFMESWKRSQSEE